MIRALRLCALRALVVAVVLGGLSILERVDARADNLEMTPELLARYSARYLLDLSEPSIQDTVFWAIAYPESAQIRYVTVNSDAGAALLVFTSPFALFEYTRHASDIPSPFGTVGWTAVTLLDRLREIRKGGVRLYVLDRPQSCPEFSAFVFNDRTTPTLLVKGWLVSRKAASAVGNKHFKAALATMEGGDLSSSLPVLSDLVSCVVPEEPRIHVLLAASAMTLGRGDLVEQAINALDWLEPSVGQRLLEEVLLVSKGSDEQWLQAAKRVVGMAADVKSRVLQP